MEKIKEKGIELLLDIISKEDFEMILYEKVKTEDLVKNKFLFELVNINYRKEDYKKALLEILKTKITEEAFIVYKVNFYSKRIKYEKDSKIILDSFNKIYDLFEFDADYNLMWDFYHINVKLDLVEIEYEDESDVLSDLKKLCFRVCTKFDNLLTINEKIDFLIAGFKDKIPVKKEVIIDKKIIIQKKWYQFLEINEKWKVKKSLKI